jgi:hypothetical protein
MKFQSFMDFVKGAVLIGLIIFFVHACSAGLNYEDCLDAVKAGVKVECHQP